MTSPRAIRRRSLTRAASPSPFGLPKGIELWREYLSSSHSPSSGSQLFPRPAQRAHFAGGFFESVRTSSGGLLLNIDTTTGAFVKSGSLRGFLGDYLGTQAPNRLFATAIPPVEFIRMNRVLKGGVIDVDLGRNQQPMRGLKIRLGLSRESAKTASFDVRGGGRTTVQVSLDLWRLLACLSMAENISDHRFFSFYRSTSARTTVSSSTSPTSRASRSKRECSIRSSSALSRPYVIRIQPSASERLAHLSLRSQGHKSNRKLSAEQQLQATAYQQLK